MATVKGITDTEQALRPAIERSRIAAEELQILAEAAKRAGSEDGLEAVVDSAQELQLQLGEIALAGKSRASPALKELGFVAADLQAQSPEAAFRAVVEELQKIPNVADRAIAAEDIFGGSSEKLAGIINLTNAEFAALETEVENTSNILSGDALQSAKDFDQELETLKASLEAGGQGFAIGMLPHMTDVLVYMNTTAVPGIQSLKADALEPLASIITDSVVPAFSGMKTSIEDLEFEPLATAVSDVLTPAFTGLTTPVGELAKDTFPAMKEHLVPVVESFTGLARAVEPLLPHLATLGENLGKPKTLLGALAVEIFPVVLPHFLTLIERVTPLAESLMPKLGEVLVPVVEGFTKFVEALGPLLPDLTTLSENLFPGQSILSDLADAVFPALEPLIIKFAELIADAAENALPALSGALELASPLLETMSGLFDTIAPLRQGR